VLDLSRTTHERLTAQLNQAVRATAERAYETFADAEMPTPKEENWRYVEVPEGLIHAAIPEGPATDPTPSALEPLFGGVAGRADIVDGHLVDFEGDLLAPLSDLEEPLFDSTPADRFAAAGQAFGGSGVVVTAGRGEAIDRPVFVSFETTTDGTVSIPRLVVRAEEAAQVGVVVEQRSADSLESLVLPQIEVAAGPAARVSVSVVQTWGRKTTSIGNVRYRADRDAFVELAEAGFGGRFSRIRLDVDLAGRGADARITGAYFGDGEQTLDYRYFMNHAAANTTSEMFLKGAVAGVARSVFTGLIRIEPDGQGTNAHQTNRNLVLTDDAEAHSVPNLEILANDVRCGHGSAVGPLDEDQRYYLMSRGLPRRRADRLQVLGFFEEALQRFPTQEIEPVLRAAAMAKYDRVGG